MTHIFFWRRANVFHQFPLARQVRNIWNCDLLPWSRSLELIPIRHNPLRAEVVGQWSNAWIRVRVPFFEGQKSDTASNKSTDVIFETVAKSCRKYFLLFHLIPLWLVLLHDLRTVRWAELLKTVTVHFVCSLLLCFALLVSALAILILSLLLCWLSFIMCREMRASW